MIFRLKILCRLASGISNRGSVFAIPALLMRTVGLPWSALIRSATDDKASESVRSTW
jgi:hypothetical protein